MDLSVQTESMLPGPTTVESVQCEVARRDVLRLVRQPLSALAVLSFPCQKAPPLQFNKIYIIYPHLFHLQWTWLGLRVAWPKPGRFKPRLPLTPKRLQGRPSWRLMSVVSDRLCRPSEAWGTLSLNWTHRLLLPRWDFQKGDVELQVLVLRGRWQEAIRLGRIEAWQFRARPAKSALKSTKSNTCIDAQSALAP